EEADVLAALVDPVLEGAVLEERLGGRAFGPGEEEGGLAGRFGAGAGGVRADPDGVAPRLRRLDDEAGVEAGRVVVAVSGAVGPDDDEREVVVALGSGVDVERAGAVGVVGEHDGGGASAEPGAAAGGPAQARPPPAAG